MDAGLTATYDHAAHTVSVNFTTPSTDLLPDKAITAGNVNGQSHLGAPSLTFDLSGSTSIVLKASYASDFYLQIQFFCLPVDPSAPACAGASSGDFVLSEVVKVSHAGGPAKRVVPSPEHVVAISSVSNGCGGAIFKRAVTLQVKLQNLFLNTVSFQDPASGRIYRVDFKDACDLHDAGYSGAIVVDKLAHNRVVDYRTWSRLAVDEQLRNDLIELCKDQLPPRSIVLQKCFGAAQLIFLGVRAAGRTLFDSDPSHAGIQQGGRRSNR